MIVLGYVNELKPKRLPLYWLDLEKMKKFEANAFCWTKRIMKLSALVSRWGLIVLIVLIKGFFDNIREWAYPSKSSVQLEERSDFNYILKNVSINSNKTDMFSKVWYISRKKHLRVFVIGYSDTENQHFV